MPSLKGPKFSNFLKKFCFRKKNILFKHVSWWWRVNLKSYCSHFLKTRVIQKEKKYEKTKPPPHAMVCLWLVISFFHFKTHFFTSFKRAINLLKRNAHLKRILKYNLKTILKIVKLSCDAYMILHIWSPLKWNFQKLSLIFQYECNS